MNALEVHIDGMHAGDIHTENGSAMFEYTPDYRARMSATPLSLSIPIWSSDPQPIDRWLDGLLPDNQAIREEWRNKHGVSDPRPAALLATPIGMDCAGAVQFCTPGNETALSREGSLDHQSEEKIAEWINEARRTAPVSIILGGEIQFSLGGAHNKYALRYGDGNWSVPSGDIPTTHIIKPGMIDYENADVVEYLCLRTAHRIGFEVANTELMRFNDERALATKRFDRVQVADGCKRLHHEDLCQALGFSPTSKYQRLGGPSPLQIVDLFSDYSIDPASDKSRFMDAMIYNWVIVASDGHSKNYSLMLDRGIVRLAPLYDVISAMPYVPDYDWGKIALGMSVLRDPRIGEYDDFRLRLADRPGAWGQFADILSLDRDRTLQRVDEIVYAVPDAMNSVIDELDSDIKALPVVKSLKSGVEQRCRVLRTVISRDARRRKKAKRVAQTTTTVTQTDQPVAVRVVTCWAPLSKGRGHCKRRLTTGPCPFHPQSPGSKAIRQRNI